MVRPACRAVACLAQPSTSAMRTMPKRWRMFFTSGPTVSGHAVLQGNAMAGDTLKCNWMRDQRAYGQLGHRIPALVLAIVGTAWPALAEVDFREQVFPILQRSCIGCHGPDQQLRGLRLDARASVVGASAPRSLVVLGSPRESELYRRIAGLSAGPRMPMGGTLSEGEIDTIRQWIEAGADWPEGGWHSAGRKPGGTGRSKLPSAQFRRAIDHSTRSMRSFGPS